MLHDVCTTYRQPQLSTRFIDCKVSFFAEEDEEQDDALFN